MNEAKHNPAPKQLALAAGCFVTVLAVILILAAVAQGRDSNDAAAKLVESLGDSEKSTRVDAARALGGMGTRAKPATPSLLRALEDPHSEVRASALAAVLNIRAVDDREWVDSVVNALVLRLSDSDSEIRAEAAKAMGLFLRPYLQRGPRRQAEIVLYFMRPSGEGGVLALLDVMRDADTKVRQEAAAALADIGPRLPEAGPVLARALQDHDPKVRAQTAKALFSLGPELGKESVPGLVAALDDQDVDVRRKAAGALAGVGPAPADAMPGLIRLLQSGDRESQTNASFALARMGPDAVDAILPLSELLFAPPPIDRDEALIAGVALQQIGARAVPRLIELTREEDMMPAVRAIRVLGAIGPDAEAAVERLVDMLGHGLEAESVDSGEIGEGMSMEELRAMMEAQASAMQSTAVRGAAGQALVGIGTETAALSIAPLLKDPHKELRTVALGVLQHMDGGAVLPVLEDICGALANDEDSDIRRAAAVTLGSLGRHGVAAVPHLSRAMEDDPDSRVKREAGRAIRQITTETTNALKEELPEEFWAAVASRFKFEPELTQLIRNMSSDLFVSYPDVQWWAFSHPGGVEAAYDNFIMPQDAVFTPPHDVSIKDILNLYLLLWEDRIAEVRGRTWLDKARSLAPDWKDRHQRLGSMRFTLYDDTSADEKNADPYVAWSISVVSPVVDMKELDLVEGTYLVIMRLQRSF